MYGYGILEDWIINDEQKLTAYRFDEESQTYLFKQVGPNSIEHETSVTDNFVFTKNIAKSWISQSEMQIVLTPKKRRVRFV